jgi:hypothetical protein
VSGSNGHHPRRAGSTLITVGYVFAVVLPVVGVIVGVMAIANGPRNHGIAITALSVVVGVLSYIWLY